MPRLLIVLSILLAAGCASAPVLRIEVRQPEPAPAIPMRTLARLTPHLRKGDAPRPAGLERAPLWASVTPDRVSIPIFSIGLKREDGGSVDLYSCNKPDLEDCHVELGDEAGKTEKLLGAALQAAPAGTYVGAFIRTCGKADSGYEGTLRTVVRLGGERYVTRDGGLVADADGEAESVAFPAQGCKREYAFPKKVEITGREKEEKKSKFLKLLFSKDDIAWAAAGGDKTRSAWDPSVCVGQKKEAGPFVCVSYPEIGVILSESPDAIQRERYQVDAGTMLTLFVLGDTVVSGYVRPYYEPGVAASASPVLGAPLKTITRGSGGAYQLDAPGVFKTQAFARKDHSGQYTDSKTGKKSYYAVQLKPADAASCAGKPLPVIRYPLDLTLSQVIGGSIHPYAVHDGDGKTGQVEGHPGIDLDSTAQLDVHAPFDGKILRWQADASDGESVGGPAHCALLATEDHCLYASLCHLKPLKPEGPVKASEPMARNLRLKDHDSSRFRLHFSVSKAGTGFVCPAELMDPELIRCRFGSEKGEDKPEDCAKTPTPTGGTFMNQANYGALKEREARVVHCRACVKDKPTDPEPVPGVTCTELEDEVPQLDGPQIVIDLPAERLLCNSGEMGSGLRRKLERCLMPAPERPVL